MSKDIRKYRAIINNIMSVYDNAVINEKILRFNTNEKDYFDDLSDKLIRSSKHVDTEKDVINVVHNYIQYKGMDEPYTDDPNVLEHYLMSFDIKEFNDISIKKRVKDIINYLTD